MNSTNMRVFFPNYFHNKVGRWFGLGLINFGGFLRGKKPSHVPCVWESRLLLCFRKKQIPALLDPGLWCPLLLVVHPSRNSECFGILTEIEVLSVHLPS